MRDRKEVYHVPKKANIKLDSYGIPLADHAEFAKQKRKIKEDMVNGIGVMIDSRPSRHAMRELEVVVVAVTDYITTEVDEVIPAEVSLVRLTLGGGLDPEQYHAIINPPSKYPLGYEAKARAHADATHCLPVDRRNCVGTDSLDQEALAMKAFLAQGNGDDRLCPVFTLEERLEITRIVFRESFDMGVVDVWCLENLLRAAYDTLHPRRSGRYNNPGARNLLVNSERSPDHHPELGCQWHREKRESEVNHCSLNMAQRWGFMLLDALNVETSLGVTLVARRHWPGPYPSRGVLIQLSAHQQETNIRRNVTSTQAADTASEGSPDGDTETGSVAGSRADSVASSALSSTSRREKTWQEIEDGPKTPVLQSSEEFPSLGGGRKQPSKSNRRGRASGSSREACGGPSTARSEAGECSGVGSDRQLSSKRNAQHASSKGAAGGVSIRNAAACLMAKSKESSRGRQQGAAVGGRGGRGGSSCTAQVEAQLRHVNLTGGPSRTGESLQHTAAFVEESTEEPSEQHGVNRVLQPLGQHARTAAPDQARQTLNRRGRGRGCK